MELGVTSRPANAIGWFPEGRLVAWVWTNANVVPVGCDEPAFEAMLGKLGSERFRASSIFGPASTALRLWELLGWQARDVRRNQPLMATSADPGVAADPLVRPATMAELDLVVPAAAAMFTEELGHPPYTGSDHWYRTNVAAMIRRGHTFVRIEEGRVIFKADVGSLALGVAQVQGVYVVPDQRGRGLGIAGMAAVVEQVRARLAPSVSLYVNDFNGPARAVYHRVGFSDVGRFATVLL